MKALLALAALAAAAPSPEPPRWSDARPPVRYQGLGATIVIFVPPEAIFGLCGDPESPPPAGTFIRACTRTAKIDNAEVPVVVLPDPCRFPDEVFAGVACHELAHRFKGWRHETP